MLRHSRRDRFAPINPERERREAAFAKDDTTTHGGTPERNEQPEYRKATPEARTVLEQISAGTHFSVEATVSVENREKIQQSPLVLDAIGDVAHPSKHVEGILQSAMEHAGIAPIENGNAGDAIAAWHDEKREKKLLLDESIAKARADILRDVTDDPETLLALIRSLEDQRKSYRALVENVERATEESDKREGSQKKRMMLRAEAAEKIQAMIRKHDGSSVEQWIKETHPEEIRYALDIADANDSGSALRRGINLLHDWRKRVTFGMFRWNASDKEPEDDVKRRTQEQYFAEVEKHITGLKGILKEKLEERANRLSKRVDEEMRRGLAEAAQKGIGVDDITQVTKTQWDGEIGAAFTKQHLITLQDAIEEINAVVARVKRSRGLKIHAEDFIDRASDFLERMDELSETNVPDLWKHAITEAQRRHGEVQSWIPDFLERYKIVRPKLNDDKAASFIAMSTGAKDGAEVRTRLDELAEMLRNPSALDRSELSYVQGTVSRLLPLMEGALDKNFHNISRLPLGAEPPGEFTSHVEEAHAAIKDLEPELASSRIQNSFTCRTLGIPQKLQEQVHAARGHLALAETSAAQANAALEREQNKDEQERLRGILRAATCQVKIIKRQMEEMQDGLQKIAKLPEKGTEDPENRPVRGYCNYGKKLIFINSKKHIDPLNVQVDGEWVSRTFDHEFGHLVVDALTERTDALSGFFQEREKNLREFALKQEKLSADDLENLLERASQSWGLDRTKIEADGRTIEDPDPEAYYRRKRQEELLLQYATYRQRAAQAGESFSVRQYTDSVETHRLLSLLEAQDNAATIVAPSEEREKLLSRRTALAFQNEDIIDGMPGAGDEDQFEQAERIAQQRNAEGN